MSQNISDPLQNSFHPITSPKEIDQLLQDFVNSRTTLQTKPEDSNDSSEESITLLKGYHCTKEVVLAKTVGGPKILPKTNVLFIVDHKLEKYFCVGQVVEYKGADYVLKFEKLFKLQRRNNFRIDLPESILKAEFLILKFEREHETKTFRLLNLSAGGFAFHAPQEKVKSLAAGKTLMGTLKIGNHDSILINCKIKHKRKESPPGESFYFYIGCEFIDVTIGLSEAIASIVNDCHRQIFSRFK